MTAQHSWSFSRIGGFEQAQLKQADDLRYLAKLDPKLWAALACPTQGLHFDQKTLHLIDQDQDGRIRVPEVLAAVAWCCEVLHDPALILAPADHIPLAALNTKTAAGQSLHDAAQHLLTLLQRPEAETISLADVTNQQKVLAQARFNGDGIICAKTATDEQQSQLITQITQCLGAVEELSGAKGINAERIKQFYQLAQERLNWLEQAEVEWIPKEVAGKDAAASLQAVREKIDDYFSRCRASQYDPRAAEQLNQSAKEWANFSQQTLSPDGSEFAQFPLAHIQANAHLPLQKGLNPAWETRVQALNKAIIQPLLGDLEQLSYEQWQLLKARFDHYQHWVTQEAGHALSSFDAEQLHSLLNDESQAELLQLVADDLAVQPQVAALTQVETLLRYRLHLKQLLNNFINFNEFYHPEHRAIFEAGTLYLDGRTCKLCLDVQDPAKHVALAGLSNCFLAYCDCTRKDGSKKSIVAAFTGGSQDYLLVGRNGVFYDREGNDWDATITRLVENPISIRQAFFSPYKRFVRFIEKQAAKNAEAAEASNQSVFEKGASELINAETNPAKTKLDLGVVAAFGVAVGGITTAIGLFLQAIFGLGWLMPLGIFGLMLLISGPAMFIAWLKLRQRNLGPLLDASGWAINGQVKINVPFGGQLTQIARLPKGARRTLRDPYRQGSKWRKILPILLFLILAGAGFYYWQQKSSTPIEVSPSPETTVPAEKAGTEVPTDS